MSSSFIGSKIAIVTKSQCRYVGTIIGIDSQASSILLGNVKFFGTENRGGNFSNNQMVGTIVPIMQFANSDIEDLNIVDEDQPTEKSSHSMPVLSSPPPPPPPPPPQKQLSIHDDPAIVSAVMSTESKDSSMSSRLLYDLQHLNLSDEQSKKLPKPEESRIHTDSGELGPTWSSLSSSHRQQDFQSASKSKFFDGFSSNNTEQFQSNRSQQRWPSNTHSTQTSRNQDNYYNEQEDDSGLPVRQPFFSNDRPYPQQQNRYQNGNIQQQQRYFYNNRRTQMNNQQRRPGGGGGGGNRETFYDNGNNYNDDFDFETSNRKFNKIVSEDEFKQQSESPNQFLYSNNEPGLTTDYEPLYNKKKSFFDNITLEETSDVQTPMYNRSRNQDTFGNDRNQYQRNRGGGAYAGGYRRSNNNNYNYRQQQQQGNENFYYRQNNNGYQYRY